VSKRLLAVLAHPDDESFGMGGTLALYARRGVEVYLVCATRGEAGEMSEEHLEGFGSIAERRESELRCAAKNLGLKEVFFLDYRDSGMTGSPDNRHPRALVVHPMEEVAEKIVWYLRKLRPQVVITFDPIGGYRHPDHIAMHNATVKAFQETGRADNPAGGLPPYQPQKLYFHTIPHTILRVVVTLMPLFGRDPTRVGKNKDIDLVSIAQARFPTHARINYRPVAKIRDEASACHASQSGGSLISGPFASLRRWFASNETFMRSYPPPVSKQALERDLFDGVIED
jgi:LmbE family N-acetylglucosaminyl deacetylase